MVSSNFLKVKFIYSKKATQFWQISTLILSYVVPVKSKVEIYQNYVAFSEYMIIIKIIVIIIYLPVYR